MFIELVDKLRCPQPHDDTWLVASVTRLEGRYVAEGALGCPECHRQYPVRAGMVDFRNDVPAEPESPAQEAAERADGAPISPGDEAVMRAAALLGLDEGGGVIVLAGGTGVLAAALESMSSANALLLNPSAAVAVGAGISSMRADGIVPLVPGCVRGAMVDSESANAGVLQGLVRALRPAGRLVAPASVPLPAGVKELARDDREWVAEAEGSTSAPVRLRRG
ncbi:MAG: hypothetical protein ABIZ91_02350 [Gemmatimonadaceae bacterium]